jgi:hypothetical protein
MRCCPLTKVSLWLDWPGIAALGSLQILSILTILMSYHYGEKSGNFPLYYSILKRYFHCEIFIFKKVQMFGIGAFLTASFSTAAKIMGAIVYTSNRWAIFFGQSYYQNSGDFSERKFSIVSHKLFCWVIQLNAVRRIRFITLQHCAVQCSSVHFTPSAVLSAV